MIALCEELLPPARRDHRATSSRSPARSRPSSLASDHGFGPTSDMFYVNAWLEQQGYLAWARRADAPRPADALRSASAR